MNRISFLSLDLIVGWADGGVFYGHILSLGGGSLSLKNVSFPEIQHRIHQCHTGFRPWSIQALPAW